MDQEREHRRPNEDAEPGSDGLRKIEAEIPDWNSELEQIGLLDNASSLRRYILSIPKIPYNTLEQDLSLGRMVRQGIAAESRLKESNLTSEEEQELQIIRKDGKEAADSLIIPCLFFVVRKAVRNSHFGVDIMDLVGSGNEGLTIAPTKYKPERGVKFLTCAGFWINKMIKEEIANSSRQVRIPRQMHTRAIAVRRTENLILAREGKKASGSEIREAMGLTIAKLDNAKMVDRITFTSLDKMVENPDGGSDYPFSDTIVDNEAFVEPQILTREAYKTFNEIAGKLPPRHEHLLRLLTGIDKNEDRHTNTLRESDIANEFGVSRQRVEQLVKLIRKNIRINGDLGRLREILGDL
jgi:RNA polymerase sigma factor (sigma-70 family)